MIVVKEDMYVGMSLIDGLFPEDVGELVSIEDGEYNVQFETSSYEYKEHELRFLRLAKIEDYADVY